MRNSCLECVRKHLGDAVAQMDEVFMGHPEHSILVEGSLSQAASEALQHYPALAGMLRPVRVAFHSAYVQWRLGMPYVDVVAKLPNMTVLLETVDDLCVQEWLADLNKQKEVKQA